MLRRCESNDQRSGSMRPHRPIQGTLMALALWLSLAPSVVAQISPVLVGKLSVAAFNNNGISDIVVSRGYAYATLDGGYPGPTGLAIFDVSDPTQPFDVGYRDGKDSA